jgi:hypothetical protein
MPTYCPDLSKCTVICVDSKDDVRVSVGVNSKDNDPEYFVFICVSDMAGCQHIQIRGATVLLGIEVVMHALGVAFQTFALRKFAS